jgi:hypothetical protein
MQAGGRRGTGAAALPSVSEAGLGWAKSLPGATLAWARASTALTRIAKSRGLNGLTI